MDLPNAIALQLQRIKWVHEDDPQFSNALVEYCSYLVGGDTGSDNEFRLSDFELSEPHMDKLQVLREMMILLHQMYESVGEGQLQTYIHWASDLIRDKFGHLSVDHDEDSMNNDPETDGGIPPEPDFQQQSSSIQYEISDFWHQHLARHLHASSEYKDFAFNLENLIAPLLEIGVPIRRHSDPRGDPNQLCKLLDQFRKILNSNVIFMDERDQGSTNEAVTIISSFVAGIRKNQRGGNGAKVRKQRSATNQSFTRIASGPGTRQAGFRFKRRHSGIDVMPKPKPSKVKTNDLGRSLLNFLAGPAQEAKENGVHIETAVEGCTVATEPSSSTPTPSQSRRRGAALSVNAEIKKNIQEVVAFGSGISLPRRVLRVVASFLTTIEVIRATSVSRAVRNEFLMDRESIDVAGWRVPSPALERLLQSSASTLRSLNLYCTKIQQVPHTKDDTKAESRSSTLSMICSQPLPLMEEFSLFGVCGDQDGSRCDVARLGRQCLAMPALRSLDLRWNGLKLHQVLTLLQVSVMQRTAKILLGRFLAPSL